MRQNVSLPFSILWCVLDRCVKKLDCRSLQYEYPFFNHIRAIVHLVNQDYSLLHQENLSVPFIKFCYLKQKHPSWMQFDDLPPELIHKVFSYFPEFILFQLLKSTTCTKQAHAVYYKNVFFSNDYNYTFIPHLGAQYVNSYVAQDMESQFKEGYPGDMGIFAANPNFHTARALIQFYKSNPYFEPHTLACVTLEDLVELEKVKPGFVAKFKHLECYGQTYSECADSPNDPAVKRILSQNFSTFVTDDAGWIPNNVERLATPFVPNKVMHTVKTLQLDGLPITNETLRKVPNVKEVTGALASGTRLDPTTLHLKKVTLFAENPADLSALHTLKDVTLILTPGLTVGYSSGCDVRIPPGVKRLSLRGVVESKQVKVAEGKHLEWLRYTSSAMHPNSNMGGMKLPHGLKEFDALGSSSNICMDLQLPETIERISMDRFRLISFKSLPLSPIDLNLGDCKVGSLPGLENLVNLTTLVLDNQLSPAETLEFPPNLIMLELRDYHDMDPLASLRKLEYFKHTFEVPPSASVMISNGAVKHLSLHGANILSIVGFEDLVRLDMIGCLFPSDMSQWKLDSLDSLTIRAQKPEYVKLPLPSSLRYLYLQDTLVQENFICPENSKFLSMNNCSLGIPEEEIPALQLNDQLEVVAFICTDRTFFEIFDNPPHYVRNVIFRECDLSIVSADFTSTNLQEFSIIDCQIDADEVKFPKGFKHLCVSGNTASDSSEFDCAQSLHWVDLSEYKEICCFDDYGEEYEYREDKRSFIKLKVEIAKIQKANF